MEPLFQLPVPSNILVSEVKLMIVSHFEELQKKDETKRKTEPYSLGKPENLRIREIFFQAPSTVISDKTTLKEFFAHKSTFALEIMVQMLPEDQTETKTSNDQVYFFLQQFHPETFTLGPRFEFETRDSEKLVSFVQRVKDHTGVKSLAFYNCDSWDDVKLLDLKWVEIEESDRVNSNSSKFVYAPDRTVLSWRITDGDLYLYKDASVPLKELSDEEKKKIKEEEDKKRKMRLAHRATYSSREESLVIKQKDVGIDDV